MRGPMASIGSVVISCGLRTLSRVATSDMGVGREVMRVISRLYYLATLCLAVFIRLTCVNADRRPCSGLMRTPLCLLKHAAPLSLISVLCKPPRMRYKSGIMFILLLQQACSVAVSFRLQLVIMKLGWGLSLRSISRYVLAPLCGNVCISCSCALCLGSLVGLAAGRYCILIIVSIP